MHRLIKHLLQLDRIFSDGDMARRREVGFLDHLALSADHAERQETFIFKALNSSSWLLSLIVTVLFLGDLDGVVGVDLRMGVTIGRFAFDHVDVAVHDVVVDVDDMSHWRAKKRVDMKIPP